MATNKILIISLTFILTTYCQEQITEELHLEENEETPETTQIYTEDYKTTTAQEELKNTYENRSIDDERVDGDDFKRREYENDTKYNVDEDVNRTLDTNVVDKDDSVENTTDYAVDVTQFSQNNDVDISHINFTNNIDIDTRTETTPVQTTTKSIVEEDTSRRIQDSGEEVETTGSRIPKADNDSERSFPENEISIPQSTKSIVRGWLEDSWLRAPIGILVPLRSKALNRALGVWSDLNTSTLNLSEVCLMAYDENGVSWRSKHDLHPTSYRNHDKTVSETLSKLLLKYQGVNTVSRTDGTMRALTGAAKLVPYDSALFVFTDEGAGDAQRLPFALRAVIEKRLKVFTIWTNPNYARVEEEGGIQALQNISKHTEGDFMPYPLQVIGIDSSSNLAGEAELEQWDPLESGMEGRRGKYITGVEVDKFDLLVVRRGGGQAISLGVPVENGVTALRVFIEGAVQHAVLYPPNDGPQIDLYNVTSVSSFSQSSRTKSYSPRDVYLVFPGNRLDLDTLAVLSAAQARAEAAALVGMWHLSVRCDTCDYRLCVSARSEVHFDVEINPFSSLKFHVTGPVASVRESQLVDEYGTELAKLSFSYQPISGDGQNVELEPTVELVADVELPPVKGSKVYAKIVGRDIRGEPFVRLSGPLVQPEVRLGRAASIVFPDSTNDLERVEEFNTMMYNSLMQQNNTAEPFSRVSQIVSQQGTLLTAVQIGLASRLYGSPGDRLQLHFEVTNYRDQAVRFSFGARGDQRFLTGINPASQRIASGQTVNVIVSLAIPTSAQPGLRDLITFTAYGNEQISMAAYVYVANPADANDIWAPEVRHNFQGTCLGRTGDDCSQHTWSVTIIARDELSGLLRLSSSPIGLLYSGDFISGTKQEVTATYRATCCAPRLLLNAVDANGNANSYIIDISTHLTDAAIAAIVLGVFLIIALILVIILLIYWCVKKRRESRELPSYNTRS